MLTLRFESDSLGSGPATTYIVEVPSFRTSRPPDGDWIDVIIDNENGVGVYHPIGHGPGNYHRLFVMNEAGKTIARFDPPLQAATKVA